MSLHLASMPLLMSDASGVSQLVNMLDSPGHADFFDEVVVGSMLADVALIVVDSCEGILLGTERAIRLALEASLPMVLVLSQLDRLMLEMRYPPDAVYIKLQGLIEKANAFVEEHRPQPQPYFGPSPPQSNVLFASAKLGTAFSLADVVRQWYLPKLMDGRGNRRLQGARRSTFSVKEQVHDLCAMLWGDHAYDAATGAFTSCTVAALALGTCKRAFVEFVLEPLYKAIALCAISESQRNSIEQLVGYLESFGTDDLDDAAPDVGLIRQRLLQRAASAGPWALLRAVCSILFAEHGELYATLTRFRRTNWPPVEAEEVGTTVLVATHWRSLDGMDTVSVGRVCGRQALEEGQLLFVQERAPNGTETVSRRTYVAQPKVPFGRVWYGIKRASPGCLVLLPQLQPSSIMLRSFALTSGRFSAAMAICLNRLHDSLEQHAMPVYGMAVAPRQGGIDLTPSIPDREILLRGGGNSAEREQICWAIEIVSRTFPGMLVSMPGEAEYRAASVAGVIAGSGELYLDVFLYDVRRLLCQRYEHLSWRCLRTNRTPFVFAFRETISGHSETIRMVARDSHPSKVSSPSLSSTSLDRETDHSNSLVEALHRPLVSMSIEPLYSFSKALQDEFAATDDANMAIVAALPNKVCFSGPERPTKQAILDSPLEMLLECSSTETVRLAESLPLPLRAVYDGLSKAIRQGPLLHAPVQGVRFCVTGVECVCGYAAWDALPSCWVPWSLMRPRLTQVAHEAAWRALAAAPLQILEPCFRVQLVLPPEQVPDTRKKLVGASKQVVIRYQHPIPGTRFVILDARVPARILVPGLEVALRYLSRGQVSIQATADPEVCPGQDCWARVPGNPLDELAADQPQERINTGAENDAWVASWILRTVRKRRGLPATLRDTLCPDSP
jgi:translation elongation factor EF-G